MYIKSTCIKLLFLGGICLLPLHSLWSQEEQPGLAEGIIHSEVLFRSAEDEGISCHRIPALVTAANGDLVVAVDERVPTCQDLRGNRDINIVIRRSSDHGKTWSGIERVADYPDGISASDPSMIIDRETGEIFLFYNYMDLDREKDVYYLHVMKSTDNGLSWSPAEDITPQITKERWHKDFKFITSGRGIQTSDGKLLHTLVNLKRGLHLFGSDDHGRSWHLIDTPLKPGDESKVVELSDGSWMVNSRANKKGMRYVHISPDEGMSWDTRQEPVLTDPGCNASILRYEREEEDDLLLFCNANDGKGRKNLTIRYSIDDGKSWSEGNTLYPGSAAYSTMDILENGDIAVVFEKDYYSEIFFLSFDLEWVMQKHPSIPELKVAGVAQPVISLNGSWKFSMEPPSAHWENAVEFKDWADILVPGECQMQGFPIRHDQPYVYKTSFRVPDDYKGKQLFLDFHGVYSHAKVWVNGTFVREHHGGFTPWSCDITGLAQAGEEAILTVEIVDRKDDISYGSGYAKHQIGGILRKVELRALPEQHFRKLYLETDLDDEYLHADLLIDYELALDRNAELHFLLLDPEGEALKEYRQEVSHRQGQVRIPVEKPALWDAEHPRLHTLVTTLLEEGSEVLVQRDRVGFREVELDGNRLLVNGRPVKLRGACRHDIHPTLGRMTTPEYDLKDVLLARESNMNFIRTSHYPPSEAFLDYCDQYGIYVEDETAVCFVGSHRTEAYQSTGASQDDPAFTEKYLGQLEEMVHHHRNHPSVIIWSVGNENTYGENFRKSFQWVKKQDPSRPVIYSYPGQVPDSITNYEILSMHYPSWQGDLKQHGITTRGFAYEDMPVLFDEWAHVACYNNFELKEDPNVRNFWSRSLDSMWTYTFEADGGLGGAIWCMLDETFMLPADLPGFNQWWGILDKNVIPSTYMGPCVGYGEWGIVDTWRRKKPEFWGTKKAYSPTRVLQKTIDDFEADADLEIPVHNRFDHTNFRELKIVWTYGDRSGILEAPELEAHEKGILHIPANDWEEGRSLGLVFYRQDSLEVDRYQLLLGKKDVQLPRCQPGELEVREEAHRITLKGKGFALDISRESGLLENVTMGGDTLIRSGPYLNLRIPGDAIQYSTLMMDDLAQNWTCTHTQFRMEEGVAVLETEGKYNGASAAFIVRMDAGGIMEILYEASSFHRESAKKMYIQEAGIKFFTGQAFDALAWESDPYFTAYPDSHPGRASGRTSLYAEPSPSYREKPFHEWEKDTRNFYYFGLDEELPFTNEARSLKENIYTYALKKEEGPSLKVHSQGKQACRFDRLNGQHTLIINDQWDYNSLMWGNYMKRMPLPETISGKMVLSLTGLYP